MKKTTKKKEHPEIKEYKNICEVTPNNNGTRSVCEKVKQDPSKKTK